MSFLVLRVWSLAPHLSLEPCLLSTAVLSAGMGPPGPQSWAHRRALVAVTPRTRMFLRSGPSCPVLEPMTLGAFGSRPILPNWNMGFWSNFKEHRTGEWGPDNVRGFSLASEMFFRLLPMCWSLRKNLAWTGVYRVYTVYRALFVTGLGDLVQESHSE